MTGITVTLHEHQHKFLTISRSVLLIMKNVQTKFVQKIKIYFVFSNFFFSKIVSFMR